MSAATLPQSRVPGSRDAPVLRWGIMGLGWIAERFTESIQTNTGQVIAAVGSRSLSRAKAFAETYDVAAAYGSYEELAAAPDIDILYVCTPHTGHHAAARHYRRQHAIRPADPRGLYPHPGSGRRDPPAAWRGVPRRSWHCGVAVIPGETTHSGNTLRH